MFRALPLSDVADSEVCTLQSSHQCTIRLEKSHVPARPASWQPSNKHLPESDLPRLLRQQFHLHRLHSLNCAHSKWRKLDTAPISTDYTTLSQGSKIVN